MKSWKTLNSKLAFNNRWFKVRQDKVKLPNGKVIDDYFLWLKPEVVLVVPITKDNKLVLTKQYKHGAGKVVIEFPAGYLNKGERPEKAASRELAEETGYSSKTLIFLKKLTNDATKEVASVYLYLAKNVVKDKQTSYDDSEEIETMLLTPNQAMRLINSGEICVSASVVAAFMAFQKLGLLSFDT